MIYRKYITLIIAGTMSAFSLSACLNDLNREPFIEVTSAQVYDDFNNYKGVLAKLYAGFALTGQQGPAGRGDVQGVDEGTSDYLRQYWQLQEVVSDGAILAWADPGVPQLNTMSWNNQNPFIRAMYYRIFYQITFANEFIREMADDRLSERGITGANLETARLYKLEARFLRALSYWHALDFFGDVPFVTENDPIGAFYPEQISRSALFDYIEGELLDLEEQLVDARQNEYARADKAAAWTLLAKLYLNSEVYTGQNRYTEAAQYAQKVIEAGYTLEPEYHHLFLTDNDGSNEIIFPIAFDGLRTQSWGGMAYLLHAPVGGNMNAESFGINSGWAGLRSTRGMVDLFTDPTGATDKRAMFHISGQVLDITDQTDFSQGYPITKFRNVNRAGIAGSDPSGNFADTDFPMFRLGDVYLIYAEAVLRGGSGSRALALGYVNELRERAFGNTSGNISDNQLTLDFILNERGRELSWEAHRRTDLIRFGRFTGNSYVWPFKGGQAEGTGVNDRFNLYPIPLDDLVANPNLNPTKDY